MDKKVVRTSNINVEVGLNAENLPVSMYWKAQDSGDQAPQAAKAMMLALFDKDSLETLKIDLWTADFQVNEMDRFMFETLRSLSDTYFRATQNRDMANALQQFAQYFGEQTHILKKEQ